MKTLEPQKISIQDVQAWFLDSFRLFRRRLPAFLGVELIFFLLVFVALIAVTSVATETPAVAITVVFTLFVTFCLYFVLGDVVVTAFSADNSVNMNAREHIFTLMGNQRALARMAVFALFVGAFYWVISLTMAVDKTVLSGCEALVDSMVSQRWMPFGLECKLAAVFLYFLVLAMFSLRIVFSLPLVLFHELGYKEAQALSHKAILINIQPMSVVLLAWTLLFMGSMYLLPIFSLLLLPLFGIFLYVAYRHVFLGITENKSVLAATPATGASVTAM